MTDAQQMLSSITRRFFKVVSEDTLRQKKIRIPRKFVRKYGETLTSPITLRLPCGLEWQIELEKCGGEVRLVKGWLEFAKHYSIEQGHFLVFRYEGNSNFHVIIFDNTAVEIEYPIDPTQFDKKSNVGKDKVIEPKREEMEYDDSLFPKTGDESSFQYSWPQKRMRTINKTYSTHLSKPKSNVIGRKQRLSNSERDKAIGRAVSGFKSENPFFLVVMQPSYVISGLNNVIIPRKFAERYMTKNEGELTLRISDDRCWPIRYKTKISLNNKSERTEIVNRGWKAFAGDNNLEVGDVCIFELIASGNKILHFQVSIVRHADHITPGKFEEKNSERPSIFSEGSASKYPSFQLLLPISSFRCSHLSIPCGFARTMFKKKRRQELELKVGKKRWYVKLINDGTKYFLSGGWIVFAKDNRLRAGDVCCFQIIQRKPVVLQVSITRTN